MKELAQRSGLFSFCAAITLQWSWLMLFHENAYRLYEGIPNPIFLSDAVLYCFAWTVGAIIGSFLTLLVDRHGRKPKKTIILFMAQLVAGVFFYVSLLYLKSNVLAAVAECAIATFAFYTIFVPLRELRPEPKVCLSCLPIVFVAMSLITRGILLLSSYHAMVGRWVILLHFVILALAYILFDISMKRSKNAQADWTMKRTELANVYTKTVPVNCFGNPRQPIWIHLFLYCVIFGILHRVHGATVISPEIRLVAYVAASILAALIFYAAFRKEISARNIWSSISRFVFPIVMISCLLMSQLFGVAAFPIYVFAEMSVNCYMFIIILAVFLIAHETRYPLRSLLGKTFAVWYLGFFVGEVIGTFMRRFTLLDSSACSVFTVLAFIILVVATFELNIQGGIKTFWGLLDDYDPKAYYDSRVNGFCQQMVDEAILTKREAQVVKLLAQNKSASDISEELVLSITTIHTHIQNIYNKLGVHSRKDLIKLVKENTQKK